jgi:hypothetical protein
MDRNGRRVGGLACWIAVAALSGSDPVRAQPASSPAWSVEVAPVYVLVEGHDPEVVRVRSGAGAENVALATDDALGYRAAVLWDRGRWAYGLDFFIHRVDQSGGPLEATAAAGGSASVELPHRTFTAPGAGSEGLYYRTLEDTTVELWVLDLVARRAVGAVDGGGAALLFGVRNADFDNDYRAIAGRGDVGGARLDASSNYSRMMGPVVGALWAGERGRHTFGADLRLAVVFGDIELERAIRDFSGPPGRFAGPPEELPPAPERHVIDETDSITVPMTDLRLSWEVRLGAGWAVGVGAGAAAWIDLAVPPGVAPARPDAREETTMVTYDAGATVRWTF